MDKLISPHIIENNVQLICFYIYSPATINLKNSIVAVHIDENLTVSDKMEYVYSNETTNTTWFIYSLFHCYLRQINKLIRTIICITVVCNKIDKSCITKSIFTNVVYLILKLCNFRIFESNKQVALYFLNRSVHS